MYKIQGGDGKEYGPVSSETLRQWINEGRANAQTQVQLEDSVGWTALGLLAEFAPLFSTPTPPVAARGAAPSGIGAIPSGAKIPNYLVQSILVTLCCCLPFGIPAIVYAAQVNSKQAVGDFAGAQDSSKKARMWCWIAFGVGLVANVIIGGIQILALAGRIGTGGMLGH
jgi:hypothetical protein